MNLMEKNYFSKRPFYIFRNKSIKYKNRTGNKTTDITFNKVVEL